MPRRPRINTPNIPQHIVQRGINREPCFFAEEDYHCYLHWLQKSAGDWHCAIHAFVLMTNHVHLLVTSERADGIAKMMQSIGQRFWVLNGRIKMRNPFILDVRLRKAKNRAGMAKTRFQPNLVERS